jgi:hypothetical protein
MAHIWDVEKEFYIKMQNHYGKSVLDSLRRQVQPDDLA